MSDIYNNSDTKNPTIGNRAASLFGFLFKRQQVDPAKLEPPSFAPREHDDGAVIVAPTGAFGTYIDLDGTVRTEAELITRYRDMSLHPEIDSAIDEIVNEVIATDERKVIKLILDELDFPDEIKEQFEECFDDCLRLLDFQNYAYNIFRRWYIDGRLYFHVIIDEDDPARGIKELRFIDPRKIRKIREVIKKKPYGGVATGAEAAISQTKNEYYIYNDRGFNYGNKPVGANATGLKIAKDAILYVTSGQTDTAGSMVLSFLHKAIKPLNQLRTLEDAVVIYRLSRAPERRIWYIDVGNLPKIKAEQYVRDIMVKHKNRLVYDASTGQVRDDRKFLNMLEDYWLPRREGEKGTQVDTLPPGQNLGQMEDVLYFQKKLYNALHVPINRLDPNNQYNSGVATEITRDEVKFGKFVQRVRNRFSLLFIKLMEKQMVLKQILTIEDFEKIAPYLRFDYAHDNFFFEMKNSTVYQNRFNLVTMMEASPNLIGKYYSNLWIRKNILMQTDEDIERIDEEIMEEMQDPFYNPPPPMGQEEMMGQPGEEGEEGSPQTAATLMDPDMVPEIPKMPTGGAGGVGQKPQMPNMNRFASNQGKDNKPGRDFKRVAQKLSKGT